MSTSGLALSRTCDLRDFPGCLTVAAWQQQLAEVAWARWIAEHHLRTRDGGVVVNYAEVPFQAPGPTAHYWTHVDERQVVNGYPDQVPAVFGLCVLDRIEAPVRFLTQAAQLLQPKGLLFLTFAYWAAEGDDTASGAEARRRIYSAHSYQRLIRDARRVGFENFGGTNWTYHGDVLDDHSLASLVCIKRPGEERS
jgi:hypothetical protein